MNRRRERTDGSFKLGIEEGKEQEGRSRLRMEDGKERMGDLDNEQ